jgi:phosphoribosylformimino-5-aminoimidazole carboxamide ribotide isomerase
LRVELYCAVDLIGGRAVRLLRGDFDQVSDFGDPLELTRRYLAAGVRRLHVVDLDAARTGEPHNRGVLLAISSAASRNGAAVQASGGVRSADDVAALLSGGVGTVVVGTVAQRDPHLVAELSKAHPGRIAVGLDHRGAGAEVAISGWEGSSGATLLDALGRLRDLPLAAVVVTSIERDGALEGPDAEGLRRVLGSTPHPVIASGGVRSTGDLASLAALEVDGRRLRGVIVGMAIAGGSLGVEEAIAACGTSV